MLCCSALPGVALFNHGAGTQVASLAVGCTVGCYLHIVSCLACTHFIAVHQRSHPVVASGFPKVNVARLMLRACKPVLGIGTLSGKLSVASSRPWELELTGPSLGLCLDIGVFSLKLYFTTYPTLYIAVSFFLVTCIIKVFYTFNFLPERFICLY